MQLIKQINNINWQCKLKTAGLDVHGSRLPIGWLLIHLWSAVACIIMIISILYWKNSLKWVLPKLKSKWTPFNVTVDTNISGDKISHSSSCSWSMSTYCVYLFPRFSKIPLAYNWKVACCGFSGTTSKAFCFLKISWWCDRCNKGPCLNIELFC